MSYTKGPWNKLDTSKLIQAESGAYVCLVLANDFIVEGDIGQSYGSNNSPTMAKANATLISTSPDLLEACEQALVVCKSLTLESNLNAISQRENNHLIGLLTAVINKAIGAKVSN